MPSTSYHLLPIRHMPNPYRLPPPATAALRLAVLLALVPAPVRAEAPLEGRYQGRGEGQLDLQVFELGDGSGAHFIVARTAILNACTGEVRGLAKPGGPAALVLTRRERGSEEVCTLTLRFGPDRKRVRMKEQGCGDFHGTSCAFDGALTRR